MVCIICLHIYTRSRPWTQWRPIERPTDLCQETIVNVSLRGVVRTNRTSTSWFYCFWFNLDFRHNADNRIINLSHFENVKSQLGAHLFLPGSFPRLRSSFEGQDAFGRALMLERIAADPCADEWFFGRSWVSQWWQCDPNYPTNFSR